MPRYREQRHLPYTPSQIFDLVADVGRYPEFLPWCVGTRVYNERNNEFDADLIIGFKMIRERFTSKVHLMPSNGNGADGANGANGEEASIRIDYIKGPLKYLHNDWRFSPVDGGTKIDFCVDFEFKNKIFQKLIGALFEEAVHHMVGAFEKRAHEIYDQSRKK